MDTKTQKSAEKSNKQDNLLELLRDDPAERLKAAQGLFNFAMMPRWTNTQGRILNFQEAIKLDPFNGRFRLEFARFKHEIGLLSEAIKEYQSALELWPDWQELRLMYAEALLDNGQFAPAQKELEQLRKLIPDNLRVNYAWVELLLRHETKSTPEKVLEALSKIPVEADNAGVFCEKCIKLLIDCEDGDLRSKVLELAEQKVKPVAARSAAYKLLKQVGGSIESTRQFERGEMDLSTDLSKLLFNYLCAQNNALNGSDIEVNLELINQWQTQLKADKKFQLEIEDAYLHVLDQWAARAYEKEDMLLAKTIWEEGSRISQANPGIIQNLALVNTRLGNEQAYHAYWQSLTRTWSAYCEVMPESDGYITRMITKHQAFIEGARKKLIPTMGSNELMELGSEWVRELVSFIFLTQLRFNNAYFIGGLSREDFLTEAQKKKLIEESYESMLAWEKLVANWNDLTEVSELSKWRRERIKSARDLIKAGGTDRFDHYDREKEAFDHHREVILQHYIQLLFGVMFKLSREGNLSSENFRKDFIEFSKIMLSFPHNLFKPSVEKVVAEIKDVPDMRELVLNHAIGYWLKNAQENLENKQPKAAMEFLKSALEVAPESVSARFLMARCHAESKQFGDAYRLLEDTKQYCRGEKETLETVKQFAENMKMAAINTELAAVNDLLAKEEGWSAIESVQITIDRYGKHPYALFMLAQAFLVEMKLKDALDALYQAKAQETEDEALAKHINDLYDLLEKDNGAQIILSRASRKMNEEKWQEALECLKKGREQAQPVRRGKKTSGNRWDDIQASLDESWVYSIDDHGVIWPPEIYFYTAICYLRLDKWDEAEREANLAKKHVGKNYDLAKQIDNMLSQIELGPVAKEMNQINEALKNENWFLANSLADSILKKKPDMPVVLFYKALSYFRMNEFDKALSVISKFDRLKVSKPPEIVDQMKQITEAIPRARRNSWISTINYLLGEKKFSQAMNSASEFLIADECAEGHYFYALACFQGVIQDSQSRYFDAKGARYKLEDCVNSLEEAERMARYSSDSGLKDAIKKLKTVVEANLYQVRGY